MGAGVDDEAVAANRFERSAQMRPAFEQYHFERVLVGRGKFAQSVSRAEAADASADYRDQLDIRVRVRGLPRR